MVIRTPVGGGIRGGLYHSQSPESLFIHVAGLKVVSPANPYDAMRMQAYRRDAAEAASISTMTAPVTATASTAVAPAVKVAAAPVVPLTPAPDVPFRPEAPQSPPPVQAPAAVGTDSSSSGATSR